MDLDRALRISAAGMQAQATRLRVVAENLANRDSTGETAEADPYRRRTITFASRLDRSLGANTVRVSRIGTQQGEFPRHFEPGHPAANEQGYVRMPNVDSLIEVMDMREAQRSYGANLAVLEASRGMLARVIEALR